MNSGKTLRLNSTRSSKLVSEFLQLERYQVPNSAQSTCSTESAGQAGPNCRLKVIPCTKNLKPISSSLWLRYSFLIVSPRSVNESVSMLDPTICILLEKIISIALVLCKVNAFNKRQILILIAAGMN